MPMGAAATGAAGSADPCGADGAADPSGAAGAADPSGAASPDADVGPRAGDW